MLTGVGAAYIDSPIYGLPTTKVEEFIADGLGAQHVFLADIFGYLFFELDVQVECAVEKSAACTCLLYTSSREG